MLHEYEIVPSFPAADLDRAKRFYAEKLGLTPKSANPAAIEYRAGAGKFGVYLTEFAGTAGHTLAAWEVDDIDRVVEDLRGRGLEFEEYDFPGMKTVNGIVDMGSQRAAWFKDSEGNILAIVQTRSAVKRASRASAAVAR